MTLEEIRKEINTIDEKLIPLFAARMECAKKVAGIKKGSGQAVFDPARERRILDSVERRAGKYGGEARLLFSVLMDLSRSLQYSLLDGGTALREQIRAAAQAPVRTERIACLGEAGSFSHEALTRLYPAAGPLFFPSFPEIFSAVESGTADLGILPVENSSAGSVNEVYDLILRYRFYIIAATTLPVRDCIAVADPDGAPVTAVYSHPQALAQCARYIRTRGLRPVPCSSTAAAAQRIARAKEPGAAAICSAYAAREYGLSVLESGIQDSETNCTRFIVISRDLILPENAQKISLCFTTPHTTGSLYRVLARFAAAGLNLTKIESRPIAGRNFEYDFYLDFTGSVREEHTLNLIASLHDELPRFSFLGNYVEQE